MISLWKKGVYNLLILDIKMPKMHGFELYRGLRTTVATRTRSICMWCKPIVACCGPSKLHWWNPLQNRNKLYI